MYVYMYVCIHTHISIYVCVYMYSVVCLCASLVFVHEMLMKYPPRLTRWNERFAGVRVCMYIYICFPRLTPWNKKSAGVYVYVYMCTYVVYESNEFQPCSVRLGWLYGTRDSHVCVWMCVCACVYAVLILNIPKGLCLRGHVKAKQRTNHIDTTQHCILRCACWLCYCIQLIQY